MALVEGFRMGVLFALKEEMRPFGKQRSLKPLSNANGRLWADHNASAVVGWSGMGASASAAMADQMLKLPVEKLLIVGFAGGLKESLRPGSVLIASEVYSFQGAVYRPDPGLTDCAKTILGPEALFGSLYSADKVVTLSSKKQALYEDTGAWAVDMETASAARSAGQAGIPWLSVRAITDGAGADLPLDFNEFADNLGRVSTLRVASAALARPSILPGLMRLGKSSAHAASALADFLDMFLKRMP